MIQQNLSFIIYHIYHYLVSPVSPGVFTRESTRNRKSLDSHNQFISRWVRTVYHYQKTGSNFVILEAEVIMKSCQRLNEDPHVPWIAVNSLSTMIETAHCTCMAGLGESRSHIGATLFKTEAAVRAGYTKKAYTDEACKWITQQNTKPAHTQITTPAPPSTILSKTPTTPSNHSNPPSKHIPFDFYFIPNYPNYITNLNLPMKLAKLCRDIQHNAESSIIKLVEDHLKRQAKLKKANKNKTKNKKATTYKPRFTPKEHKPTSPTLTSHPPSQSFKTFNQYPKSSPPPQPHTTPNQSITTSLQPAPNSTRYYNALLKSISNQTPTIHQHTHSHTHHQLAIIHSNTDRLHHHPYTTHPQHNTHFQPTHKTYTTISHPTVFTVVPKPSHTYLQYKHTPTHHANNNNQAIKTMHTNTT